MKLRIVSDQDTINECTQGAFLEGAVVKKQSDENMNFGFEELSLCVGVISTMIELTKFAKFVCSKLKKDKQIIVETRKQKIHFQPENKYTEEEVIEILKNAFQED